VWKTHIPPRRLWAALDIHGRAEWWHYLVIAVLALIIVGLIAGVIYVFKKKRENREMVHDKIVRRNGGVVADP
jgi:predicted histidine transporter YuiF (NhaC family)